MTPSLHLWLIPALPLLGAAINGLFGRRFSRQNVSAVALAFSGAAFLMVLYVAARFSSLDLPHSEVLAHWIRSGSFMVNFEFYLDQLTLIMLLVVTGVGLLIHIYSVGYMWEEGGFYRFFAYLNLFMFFMLTLVLAGNYLQMFIGWEGVGLASYLLIGFLVHERLGSLRREEGVHCQPDRRFRFPDCPVPADQAFRIAEFRRALYCHLAAAD